MFFTIEMIFVEPLFDSFFSDTHIMFLLSLSTDLVFVPIPLFLCKIMVVPKVVNQMVVQITQLFLQWLYCFLVL
jgi:hypothetical protein